MTGVRRFVISTVPPGVNSQWKPVRMGKVARLVRSDEYKKWAAQTEKELAAQPGFEGNFIWRSEILFPCNFSGLDVDNCPKAIHDILVKLGKVPDDRYLADSRIRWASGRNIVVAIQQEELEKWAAIKNLSTSLMKKLAKFSASSPRLL